MAKKIYYQRMVQKRKDNGLCVTCGKPLDRDGTNCTACRQKINERERSDRLFYAEHGVCPRCRKNTLYGDEKECIECSAKTYEQVMSKRGKDPEHYNKIHREWSRKEYQRRKENGICTRCGKREADKGYTTCGICRAKGREKKRKYNEIERTERYKIGLCFFCDNPVKEGYKVCEKHYEMNVKAATSQKAKEARDKMYKFRLVPKSERNIGYANQVTQVKQAGT